MTCQQCNDSGWYIVDATNTTHICHNCDAYTQHHVGRWRHLCRLSPRQWEQTLETYQPKDAKQKRTLEAVSQFSDTSKGLMLFGPVGTGKTHLATGIMRRVLGMGKTAVFWNWSDYIHNVKQTFNSTDSRADFDGLERAETADLLVLDDLGAARTTDFVDEELYWLVNRRYDLGRGIVVTSNLTPRMMREEIEAGKASSYFERAWSRVLGMSGKDGLIFLEGNDHRQEWGE